MISHFKAHLSTIRFVIATWVAVTLVLSFVKVTAGNQAALLSLLVLAIVSVAGMIAYGVKDTLRDVKVLDRAERRAAKCRELDLAHHEHIPAPVSRVRKNI